MPENVNRLIVREGLPTEPGWYYLWHQNCGWPVINVLQVQVEEGHTYYFIGVAGTDDKHRYEVLRMVGCPANGMLGYSEVTPEAFYYFKTEHERTREAVLAMIAARDAGED